MKSWIAMVFASIALASPALAQEDLASGAEARRSAKARLELEHAHRIEIARALAEHQEAMRRDVLRSATALVAPMDATQFAAELRPLLPARSDALGIDEKVAMR